jgi:hypothetical protein
LALINILTSKWITICIGKREDRGNPGAWITRLRVTESAT